MNPIIAPSSAGDTRILREDRNTGNIAAILTRCGSGREACIKILQELQAAYGYLPVEVFEAVAQQTQISLTQIYGVATFYAQFSFTPRGRHIVRPCRGTACHVRGAKRIVSSLQDYLGVTDGGTTKDLKFSFETVACVGTCFLSPVVMVDDHFYGKLSPEKARKILDACE